MPQIRINSLKSRAMKWGPSSEMMRGVAWGIFSRARCKIKKKGACPVQFCLARQLSRAHNFATKRRLDPWSNGQGVKY
jgi:hypothetical protein